MSKKDTLKKVVKGGVAPETTFGKDPSDPWSSKANIGESASLNQYLSSKGINPKFVSRDTKIAHSKSAEFQKWKRDHMFEQVFKHTPTMMKQHLLKKKERHGEPIKTEEVDKKDTITLDIPFMIRVLEYAREDAKDDMALHKVVEKLIELRNKGTLTMDDYDFVTKIKEEYQIDEAKKPSSLEKWRSAADQREKEAKERTKEMEKLHAAGGEDMKGAIDRLAASLKKEDVNAELKQKLYNMERRKELRGKGLLAPKPGEVQPQKKMSEEDEKMSHKVGDSVTVHSKFFGKQKGKVTKVDNQSVHVQRNGKNSSEKYPHDAVVKEAVYQDTQAATQTNFDGANNTDDTVTDRRREMSKSARMIKAIYKKKGVVKEEIYDHEKEDKSVATYGKKPKMAKTDERGGLGGKKPEAAAILTGGKTLTGQPRDDIEIDPMMKKRPNQPVNDKTGTGTK